MKLRNTFASSLAMASLAAMTLAPVTASAQHRNYDSQHRQNQKNEWTNLTIGSAAVAVLGLATHNKALTTIGAAGALYSGYRLGQENDRHRNTRYDRDRYNRDQYNRDRYDRDQYGRDRYNGDQYDRYDRDRYEVNYRARRDRDDNCRDDHDRRDRRESWQHGH